MIVVRDLQSTQEISNTQIRALAQLRINDLGGEEIDAALGYLLIVVPGDSLDAINAQVGFDVMANRMTGIRFGEFGFTPSFEFVEEFPYCYDMVFIISDDGYGIELFIPKTGGSVSTIDPQLLAMCRRYSTPGDSI